MAPDDILTRARAALAAPDNDLNVDELIALVAPLVKRIEYLSGGLRDIMNLCRDVNATLPDVDDLAHRVLLWPTGGTA